jgi:hypothetical protein
MPSESRRRPRRRFRRGVLRRLHTRSSPPAAATGSVTGSAASALVSLLIGGRGGFVSERAVGRMLVGRAGPGASLDSRASGTALHHRQQHHNITNSPRDGVARKHSVYVYSATSSRSTSSAFTPVLRRPCRAHSSFSCATVCSLSFCHSACRCVRPVDRSNEQTHVRSARRSTRWSRAIRVRAAVRLHTHAC